MTVLVTVLVTVVLEYLESAFHYQEVCHYFIYLLCASVMNTARPVIMVYVMVIDC